jgi:enoyl-CoA hydratase/carnithine racemase
MGAPMDYPVINLAHDGPLAILTLNRPDRLDALDWTLARELLHATQAVMADDKVRGVLLTGAGRGFCAGADLKDVHAGNRAGERFDAAALMPAAYDLALRLATGPTLAYAAMKRMNQASVTNDLPHQLDLEASQQGAAFDTTDFAEGVAAFAESRTPSFSGA